MNERELRDKIEEMIVEYHRASKTAITSIEITWWSLEDANGRREYSCINDIEIRTCG